MPDPVCDSYIPILDINIDFAQWQGVIDASIKDIEKAVALVINHVVKDKTQFEISILFTSDDAIQKLNKDYRQKDAPTNVLSFPQIEKFSDIKKMQPPVMLGDIILGWKTVSWEAASQEKVLAHHIIHLIIHGLMHLLGFDHISDTEAAEMEKIEIEILRHLHIPNPYL